MYGSISQIFIVVAKGESNLEAERFLWVCVLRGLVPSGQAEHSSGQLTSQQPGSTGRVDPLAGFLLSLLYSFMAPNP